ncbi:MAG TPA: hypothetical protein VHS13_04035 [Edaphobacter sp.]|nr:hypothetical protein [Edaphobacter sp.]
MRKIKMLTFVAGVIALMSCLPAMAQVKVTFTTSFGFYAGGAKLPAGTYTIRQQQDDPNMFEVQNSAGTHSVLVDGRASSKSSKGNPEVVFNRYGTTECLEGVLTSTGNSVDIETGPPEKLAAKKGSPQSHSVPAK